MKDETREENEEPSHGKPEDVVDDQHVEVGETGTAASDAIMSTTSPAAMPGTSITRQKSLLVLFETFVKQKMWKAHQRLTLIIRLLHPRAKEKRSKGHQTNYTQRYTQISEKGRIRSSP